MTSMDLAREARHDDARTVERASDDERLLDAKVLVALGDLDGAEREVEARLEEVPDDLTALNLVAKVKHMKGELSQAIACWAQLHARSPHNELALMRLASIMQLARDPEKHAGEFLALQHSQLAKSPALSLELVEAFRHLLARRFDEAHATCDRLARKHEPKDRDLYKLCVIAKAWIAELSGQLDVARDVLEGLGKERGFETDTDRVLSLARVYERSGDAVHLAKAVHIHQFLDRSFEKLSAQARLAALCRKLGRVVEAEAHERRFEIAFERRMHRPSRVEIARAASRRYLPLGRLRAIRPSTDPAGDLPDARSRALHAFLSGDEASALAHFEHASDLIDRKYLADLRGRAGDGDAAVEPFLQTLREDPSDEHVLSFLLSHWEGSRDPRIAEALASAPDAVGARVQEALDRALRSTPRRAALWHWSGAMLAMAGDATTAARHRDRAQALEEAQRRDSSPVGRVLAAAVYRFVGKGKGLIHQIWADRKPAPPGRGGFLHAEDILGNVTPEMRHAVRNTFFAVREYARSRFPHRTTDILDYDYAYKVTKEDEPSGGLSAGLPTALAFLSVFLQTPVPQDMAFSGVVIADAHDVLVVRAIAEAEYKVKGAYHRNLRAIVLPADNRHELAQNQQVPRAVCDELVRYAGAFDEAITLTFGSGIWLD
ncbi:MAG: hypothetical protein KF819_31805 [Labilithrix sp.]|nr:hypothetical protein [Labilithrix sp.]